MGHYTSPVPKHQVITERSHAAFDYGDSRILYLHGCSGPGAPARTHPVGYQRDAMQQRRSAETRGDVAQWKILVSPDCVRIEPNGRKTALNAHKPSENQRNIAVKSDVILSEYESHDEYEIAPGLIGIVSLEGNNLTLFSKGRRKPFERFRFPKTSFSFGNLRRRKSPSFATRMARSLTTSASRPGNQP
jgi:hypothetical protein